MHTTALQTRRKKKKKKRELPEDGDEQIE